MQIATRNSAVKTQVSKLHKFINYSTSNYCESTMSIVLGGHYIVTTKTNTNFFHETFSKWEFVRVCVCCVSHPCIRWEVYTKSGAGLKVWGEKYLLAVNSRKTH